MLDDHELVPAGTPAEVLAQAQRGQRVPNVDPTLGIEVPVTARGTPNHRLVVIGDSLSHGFQSGAIFNTALSYPAIIATELGWSDYRFPTYGDRGGLPVNVEYLLRELEAHYGQSVNLWEIPAALLRIRTYLDGLEDYWERGPGSILAAHGYVHDLAVYGWNLRDALTISYASTESLLLRPRDNLVSELVENSGERAALRVYPNDPPEARSQNVFEVARHLGDDHGDQDDPIGPGEPGIETLIVMLGANNALLSVTDLALVWTDDAYGTAQEQLRFEQTTKNVDHDRRRLGYTVWRPDHFRAELSEVVAEVRKIGARHVIWCTVPHVTIAPIARGVGSKINPRSRYFDNYTRPWIDDEDFDPADDPHLTSQQARVVDAAIDTYNAAIEQVVRDARNGSEDEPPRDWLLFEFGGLLERLATRRYRDPVTGEVLPDIAPPWWTPYPLPPELQALAGPDRSVPDTRFLRGNGSGGRAQGGLFSLDGVHPTTIGYGIVATELITIMARAGVVFPGPDGQPRTEPRVDFERLIAADTLVRTPPQNIGSTLSLLGWLDQHLDWIARVFPGRHAAPRN